MSARKPSELERLSHIIEAIDRIFKFVGEMDFQEFSTNEMAQFAIIKNFEIIGEAAYKLPKDFYEDHDKIEWRKIIAFRHILVHDYYKINPEIVWNAIENKLIDLKKYKNKRTVPNKVQKVDSRQAPKPAKPNASRQPPLHRALHDRKQKPKFLPLHFR